LEPLRVELAGRVREGLAALGYSGEAVGALVSAARDQNLSDAEQAALLRQLQPETPMACLVRAFGLHLATEEAALRRHLGDGFFDLCAAAGLWTEVPDGLTGTAVMMSHKDCFVLSDHEITEGDATSKHWVMGLGISTGQVAQSVIRRRYDRVLDLCCGSGVQSFLMHGLAREFVALDLNGRALNFGRFGAAMNGYTNIDFRESDCYSAVAGESFDAIVCNPPFAVSPGGEKMYRDGGMSGDGFARRVISGAPGYLREGGFAFFVCDVAAIGEASSEDRLREWVEGLDCDVVALAAKVMDAAAYARVWLAGEEEDAAKWREYLAAADVRSISNWHVVLRKRSCGGANWFRSEPLSEVVDGHFGAQIERRFRGHDFLLRDEAAIWNGRLRLAPEVRVERTARAEGGRWVTEGAKVLVTAGLMASSQLDPRTVDFFPLFDGVNTMEAILGRVAGAMGVPADKLRGGWLKYVSQLTLDGILEDASND
jgi:SAM-dependent methyltransferase